MAPTVCMLVTLPEHGGAADYAAAFRAEANRNRLMRQDERAKVLDHVAEYLERCDGAAPTA